MENRSLARLTLYALRRSDLTIGEHDYVSVFVNPLFSSNSSENVFFKRDFPKDKAFKACWFVLFFQTDLRMFFFIFEVRFLGTAIIFLLFIKSSIYNNIFSPGNTCEKTTGAIFLLY